MLQLQQKLQHLLVDLVAKSLLTSTKLLYTEPMEYWDTNLQHYGTANTCTRVFIYTRFLTVNTAEQIFLNETMKRQNTLKGDSQSIGNVNSIILGVWYNDDTARRGRPTAVMTCWTQHCLSFQATAAPDPTTPDVHQWTLVLYALGWRWRHWLISDQHQSMNQAIRHNSLSSKATSRSNHLQFKE